MPTLRLLPTALLVAGCLLAAGVAPGQPAGPKTWCNPVDIAYRYNFEQLNEGISYRSGPTRSSSTTGRILPVPDHCRGLVALQRSGPVAVRDAYPLANGRHGCPGGPVGQRHRVPVPVQLYPGAHPLHHHPGHGPPRILQPLDAPPAPADRPLGPGPVLRRRPRQVVHVLGFFQHLPPLRRRTRPRQTPGLQGQS
jgi:hypothetical protein